MDGTSQAFLEVKDYKMCDVGQLLNVQLQNLDLN